MMRTHWLQTITQAWALPGLVSAWVLCSPIQAQAQVSNQIRTNFYVVTGRTLGEIHQSLKTARPWRNSSLRDARTDWRIDYRTKYVPSPQGCRLGNLTVKLSVTITLPTLQTLPGTDPKVAATWQAYLTKLMKHEQKHLEIAKASANQMLQRIRSAGSDANCGALTTRVSQLAAQVIAECQRQHAEYDRRTRHGIREGVVLPGDSRRERHRRPRQREIRPSSAKTGS